MHKTPADINLGPKALVGDAVTEFLAENPGCPGMIARALAQLAEMMDEGGHTLAAYSQASKQFQALAVKAIEMAEIPEESDELDDELKALDAALEEM